MEKISLSEIKFIHLIKRNGFHIIWIEGNYIVYNYLSLPNPGSNFYTLKVKGNLITEFVKDNHTRTNMAPQDMIILIEKQLEINWEFPKDVDYINFN